MLSDKECIYPPPVLCKDIMKLQLFKGCRVFGRRGFCLIDCVIQCSNCEHCGIIIVSSVNCIVKLQ